MSISSIKRTILVLSLTGTMALANAQPIPGVSADELLVAAQQALKQIDGNQLDELWEQAPAFVKAAKTKTVFADELRRARAKVGTVSGRSWASVTRVRYPDVVNGIPPGGLYANVDVATQVAGGQVVFEKVSFRLEPGGWRLTGYEPRENQ